MTRNPYKVSSSQMTRMWIHKDLAMAIKKERKKIQDKADKKFNKKYKVPMSFVTKFFGRQLK